MKVLVRGAPAVAMGFMMLSLSALLGGGCRTPLMREADSVERIERVGAAHPSEQAAPFLLPAEALGETFVLRQTVTVRWVDAEGEAEEASFDAAIQRQGDSLLVLGLGPMGRVGFTLSLAAGEVAFENRTGQALPFAPARMLADVQRVYYPWLDDVPLCDDCIRRGTRGGFIIEEERVRGGVVRRRFVALDLETKEGGRHTIEVVYSGDPTLSGVPLDALLRHEGFGYEVELNSLGIDWID